MHRTSVIQLSGDLDINMDRVSDGVIYGNIQVVRNGRPDVLGTRNEVAPAIYTQFKNLENYANLCLPPPIL